MLLLLLSQTEEEATATDPDRVATSQG